jgi:cell division initiation protein
LTALCEQVKLAHLPRVKGGKMQEELVPEYIEGRDFSTSLRGYDKGEVDSFLSSIAAEIRDYQRANSERLYQNLGEEMGSLLQHAKDSSDAMRKEAEEDAAAIRHTAESDAQRTRADAEHKSSDIRAAAEADAAERIKEAEDRVRALESVERDARERVRALRGELEVVAAQLTALQGESGETDLVQPGLTDESAQIDLDEDREIALGSNEQTAH